MEGGKPAAAIGGQGLTPGFTLVELLVALAILSAALTVIMATFVTAVNAWRRGSAFLEELHHGEIVMNQLVTALRSAAYFTTHPSKYGMRFTDDSGRYPADSVSWVCSGEAFLPPDSPLAGGLHRLLLEIGTDDRGEPVMKAWAYPPLMDEEGLYPESWTVSDQVRGLNLRFYDPEDQIWEEDWEDTNSLPRLVEVSLYLDPLEEYGEPVVLKRLVEIPLAPELGETVLPTGRRGATGTGADGRAGSAAGEPLTTERSGRTTIIRR